MRLRHNRKQLKQLEDAENMLREGFAAYHKYVDLDVQFISPILGESSRGRILRIHWFTGTDVIVHVQELLTCKCYYLGLSTLTLINRKPAL